MESNDYKKGLKIFEKVYREKAANTLSKIESYDKELADVLIDTAYGRILSRPCLDLKTKELCIVSMLIPLGKTLALKRHISGALNVGVKPEHLREVLVASHLYVGWPLCLDAFDTFQEVLEERKNRKKKTGR
jgi:alkylhydroperoxidase/carboxymuconolactone decarboxylase family protein YurZ